jgi:molybdopterin-guanine dinucleotide biosynthesis protein A
MPIALAHISGMILAGGQGQRMGHVDKGLQAFLGRPLTAHLIQRLRPQVQSLAINANRHLDDYAAFGLPLWPDLLPGFAGPLAGLHTGLSHCTTDYLAVAPCDSPLLPQDLVARLAQALEQQHAMAAIAVTNTVSEDRPTGMRQRHPVFCLLRKSLLSSLSAYLQQDGRKMERWFASIDTTEVHFDDALAFSNINTLAELHRLEQLQALKQPHVSDNPLQEWTPTQ